MVSPKFSDTLGMTTPLKISEAIKQREVITKTISEDMAAPIDNFSPSQKKVNDAFFQGECYLRTKQENFKKHWVVIRGNELYCYKDVKDPVHIIMHTLTGIFVRDLAFEILGDENM